MQPQARRSVGLRQARISRVADPSLRPARAAAASFGASAGLRAGQLHIWPVKRHVLVEQAVAVAPALSAAAVCAQGCEDLFQRIAERLLHAGFEPQTLLGEARLLAGAFADERVHFFRRALCQTVARHGLQLRQHLAGVGQQRLDFRLCNGLQKMVHIVA